MLLEQQQLIESLKTQLYRLLKHRFGPRTESIDVNQFGLFIDDGSLIVEVPEEASERATANKSATTERSPRKKAVRILEDLPRVIREIDVPESQRTCTLSPTGILEPGRDRHVGASG